jgi:pimeloyl-ACP methyl ester carboxylesterase
MKLFFRHFGKGDPLIILHGLLGMSDNWVTLGRRLANHFSVYIPDQRNHGHSPHSHTFNFFALTEDLLEFLEEHDISNPVLIGHSMGGKVAMNFVMDVSLPVRKLVVIDISPRSYSPRQEHIQILQAMQSTDPGILNSRTEVEKAIGMRIKSERIRAFILKNLYRIHNDGLAWRLNLHAIGDNLELISGASPASGTYHNPVLFIKGADSDYITAEDEHLIRTHFPEAWISEIPAASHWVHADQPEVLYRVLAQFLEIPYT